MSAFEPTTITLHPPADEDPCRVALVAALDRNLGYKLTWNLPVVLVLGLATAGLAPLFVLLLRFRTFVTGEKFQLEHVNEWLQETRQTPSAAKLATFNLRMCWRGSVILGFMWGLTAAGFAVAHLIVAPEGVLALWTCYAIDLTKGYGLGHTVCLTLGYLTAWKALAEHVENVDQFRQATGFAAQDGLYWHGIVPGLPWLLAGVLLGALGCIWGPAMMLAAGAHRRYINEVSGHVRSQIARRIEG